MKSAVLLLLPLAAALIDPDLECWKTADCRKGRFAGKHMYCGVFAKSEDILYNQCTKLKENECIDLTDCPSEDDTCIHRYFDKLPGKCAPWGTPDDAPDDYPL
ncbi:unnamed protein product, partial [Mesorhabditis spiculigera]